MSLFFSKTVFRRTDLSFIKLGSKELEKASFFKTLSASADWIETVEETVLGFMVMKMAKTKA